MYLSTIKFADWHNQVADWDRPRNQRWQNMHFPEGTIFVLKRWRFWIDHNVSILD